MKPITQITNKFPSLYAAGKALNIHPQQLSRWINVGAMLDDDGNVWIKTGSPVDHKKARQ